MAKQNTAVVTTESVDQKTGEILDISPRTLHDVIEQIDTDQSIADQQRLANAFDKAVRALVGPNDVQMEGNREFKKKSAWRKLGRAFGLSTEIIEAETWWEMNDWEDGPHCISRVRVRAVSPWGQYAEAIGKCSTRESRFYRRGHANFGARAKADHDCEATAQTRATNRAISDLIAAGEVSAEELEGARENGEDASTSSQPPAKPPAATGGSDKPATQKQLGFINRLARSEYVPAETVEALAKRLDRLTTKEASDAIEFLQKIIADAEQHEQAADEAAAAGALEYPEGDHDDGLPF